MGNGRYPKKHRGARIWKLKLHGTPAKANFRNGNVNRGYRFKRTSCKAFRYGGPGRC